MEGFFIEVPTLLLFYEKGYKSQRLYNEEVNRMAIKITILVVVAVALTVGLALFSKWLENRRDEK